MNILIAENHQHLAQFFAKGLRCKGYNIDIAEDGKIALRMGSAIDYNVVLLDVGLSCIDGFDVCRMLREAGLTMPVIMMSDGNNLEDKLKGFENGANDYLIKPFAFEELLVRIQSLLSINRQVKTNTILQEADLRMDSEGYEVTRAGVPIGLTQKEFSLLQYLLQRKRRVLPRAMIEEQVWGYQKDSMTNIVDVYIRKLRKKIDENFDPPLIHTVRGVGYKLNMPERRSSSRLPDYLYHQSVPDEFAEDS